MVSLVKGVLFTLLSSLILLLIYHVVTVSYALFPHANLESFYLTPPLTRPFKKLENDPKKLNLVYKEKKYGFLSNKKSKTRSELPYDTYENEFIKSLGSVFLDSNYYFKFEELVDEEKKFFGGSVTRNPNRENYREIYKELKAKYHDSRKALMETRLMIKDDAKLVSMELSYLWNEITNKIPYTRKVNEYTPVRSYDSLIQNLIAYYSPTIDHVLGETAFEYSNNSLRLEHENIAPRVKKYTLKINMEDLKWQKIKKRFISACGEDFRCQPQSLPLVVVFTATNSKWSKVFVNGQEVKQFPNGMHTSDKMVFMLPEQKIDVLSFVVEAESPNTDLYRNSFTHIGLSFGVEFPELGVVLPKTGAQWIDVIEIEWSFFEMVEKAIRPTAENFVALSIIFSALLLWSYIGYLLFSKRTFKLKRLLISRLKPK
ncbi:hypothetical protein ACOI22_02725 [Glaciecola sp. 2405UD65-10]|uniref:hypothetical protein n=1 Tax=Glaciecola sp. 2405UD65-10 TaxID=3397244 RepID=UPI003B595F1D